MSRDVPFAADAGCDGCSAIGAYDFGGDFLCQNCVDACEPDAEASLPTVVSEATINLGQITVRVLHLSDGQRVIDADDADDAQKLFAALFGDAP